VFHEAVFDDDLDLHTRWRARNLGSTGDTR